MTANTLQSKAVLADLTIRLWTGRKLDREISDEINIQHNAEADAGRYNKLLISKEAFTEVYQVSRDARVLHRVLTQPWFDEGARILPSALYEDFAKRFRKLREEFNTAADTFYNRYPSYVSGAKKRLNGMFKASDYPAHKRVRSLFSFELVILPLPDVKDFRVKISQEQLEDTERQLQEALGNAMKEPYRRVTLVTTKMVDRLKNYKPADGENKAENTFRNSLVENIRELAELLPAFNLTNDAGLTKITQRIKSELCVHDANILREDESLREQVAKSAEDILKQASALLA